MAKYVLITESGNDVPADIAQEYGIYIAPMHVTFGGTCLDDGTFPATDIFDHYARTKELPKTSGCMPSDFEAVFNKIEAEQPDAHMIYLAYSAATTCSYESALVAMAGRKDEVKARFHAYDTKAVAAGGNLVVQEVAEFIAANPEVDFEELDAYIKDRISRSRMHFTPGSLEFLRAGGRLSNVAFLGATLLNIKPIIELIDGKLTATKKRRGSMEKCVMSLVEDFITEEPKELKHVQLIWGAGLDEKIREKVTARCQEAGFEDVRWIQTGGVIASHSGPGAFGITAMAL